MSDNVEPPPLPGGAMDQFWQEWKDYRWIVLYIFTFGLAPAALDAIFAIAPPWPARAATSGFTSAAMWIFMIGVFAYYPDGKKPGRSGIAVSAVGSGALLLGYCYLTSAYTYDAPDWEHRIVGGTTIRDDILTLLRTPGETVERLLKGCEFKPECVWLRDGIVNIRFALLACWFGFIGSVSYLAAAFVVFQHKRHKHQLAEAAKRRTSAQSTESEISTGKS